ncbi:MAG: ERF family protein [Clostridia bacterium]|nr:ERF family protein [Clostridia bacterium]
MAEIFLDKAPKATHDTTRNVYQRMHAVMRQITYVEKSAPEGGEYAAMMSDAVVSALRSALIQHGLVIFPVEVNRTRSETRVAGITNHLTELDVVYKIQNVDDPKDFALCASTGAGADLQDKGSNKALTAAYKYMARQAFAISSKLDDPDLISSDEYTRQITEKAQSGEYLPAKKGGITFEPVRGTAETSEPLEL